MAKYRVYGVVIGSKYLGTFEADSAEAAREKAVDIANVNLCHQCSSECEDPQIDDLHVEPVETEAKKEGP